MTPAIIYGSIVHCEKDADGVYSALLNQKNTECQLYQKECDEYKKVNILDYDMTDKKRGRFIKVRGGCLKEYKKLQISVEAVVRQVGLETIPSGTDASYNTIELLRPDVTFDGTYFTVTQDGLYVLLFPAPFTVQLILPSGSMETLPGCVPEPEDMASCNTPWVTAMTMAGITLEAVRFNAVAGTKIALLNNLGQTFAVGLSAVQIIAKDLVAGLISDPLTFPAGTVSNRVVVGIVTVSPNTITSVTDNNGAVYTLVSSSSESGINFYGFGADYEGTPAINPITVTATASGVSPVEMAVVVLDNVAYGVANQVISANGTGNIFLDFAASPLRVAGSLSLGLGLAEFLPTATGTTQLFLQGTFMGQADYGLDNSVTTALTANESGPWATTGALYLNAGQAFMFLVAERYVDANC